MELIHDYDVEMRRVDFLDIGAVQALDRCENVFEPLGSLAADPFLAEGRVAQRMPERCAALIDDFFAVCNKQKAAASEVSAKPHVIDSRHHCLPGACCGDQQIAMMALVASEHNVFKQRLLEGA